MILAQSNERHCRVLISAEAEAAPAHLCPQTPDMILAQSNERDCGGLISTEAEAATAHLCPQTLMSTDSDMILAQSNERDCGGLISTEAEAATAHCETADLPGETKGSVVCCSCVRFSSTSVRPAPESVAADDDTDVGV
jgi:hypothetical protein